MTIRAILFDLDGTLIDQFQPIYKSFSQVISQMGFPVPSFDTVKKSVGGASEKTMSKLIGEEHAKEAVQLLRPIFEKEMGFSNYLVPVNYCHSVSKRKLKPQYSPTSMDLTQEQSANI